jgi:hypothetical protein
MPQHLLDLSFQAWTRTYGDITVIGTWRLDTDRPVIVLVPTFTPLDGGKLTPCVIPLDQAYQWNEITADPGHSARKTYEFCEALRFTPTPALQIRIHNIINDCLGDLLRMPPMPRYTEGEAVADVIAVNTRTGKTIEAEVIDHV